MPRTIARPVLLALGTAACFTWRPYEPAAPLAQADEALLKKHNCVAYHAVDLSR